MAVARPQSGGSASGMKALLIVFICLTVASLAGTIVLYTFQEDIKNQAADANNSVRRAQDQMREANRQYSVLAERVLGQGVDASDAQRVIDGINTQIDQMVVLPEAAEGTRLKEIVADIRIDDQTPVIGGMQELFNALVASAAALTEVETEHGELQRRLDELTASVAQVEKDFKSKSDELQARVKELEALNQEHREKWDAQVTTLSDQLGNASASASQELNREREKSRELEEKLAESTSRIKELLEQLASFKPSVDTRAILREADGFVTQTVPGEDVVYINLGLQDGVKAGMTFAVYSRVRGIPDDGKGKASLEVINAFGTISECRVTQRTEGDPILQGDPVANPVFDRTHRYNFVVAGDFDLDYDGVVEDPNGEQVARLIKAWGGQVSDKISTETDFVVLGSAPTMTPVAPDETGKVDEDKVRELEAEVTEARKLFDEIVSEAKALAIPILTRKQFLHFIGQNVPTSAEEDAVPAS